MFSLHSFLKKILQILKTIQDDSFLRKGWRLLPDGFRSKIRTFFHSIGMDEPDYLVALNKIGDELNSYKSVYQHESLKILYGPSFCIYGPCFIHDRLLSYALRLQGAQIIPIYCDAIQPTECEYWNGVWMGNQAFKTKCKGCVRKSQKLWEKNPIPAIKLSKYLQGNEIEEIEKKIECLNEEQWITYVDDGMPFGRWVKDLLLNGNVVGNYKLVPDYHERGLAHLKNLLLLKVAYERVLDDVKPSRVVSNNSYYGMFAILQELCIKKCIPFYSHFEADRQSTWNYAYNDTPGNLDFSKPWKKFSQIPLKNIQKDKIKNWLKGRNSGKNMVYDTLVAGKHLIDEFDLSKMDNKKPTALLAGNVVWDLSSLNTDIVFPDMVSWIVETINWFAHHPEYQLIIRPHPGETFPSVPITEERVETELLKRGVQLPKNVFLLPTRLNMTVYQLFPLIQVGLVYTTTVGLEMAASKIPVITSAKAPYRGFGFTFDPSKKQDYFNILDKILQGKEVINFESQVDLAYKFLLFYHFHFYTKINIMDYVWATTPKIKIKSIEDLLPGNNKCRDYVTESIMKGLPILSEDRWPPES